MITETETSKAQGRRKVQEPQEIEGVRGVFTEVDKQILFVDDTYQRDESRRLKTTIETTFSWYAFGTLSAAKRADGRLYVFDGQHRLSAAKARREITTVPCMVFDISDLKDEAAAFYKMNSTAGRKPLMRVDVFKAQLTMENPLAVKINAMIERIGRVPGHGGKGSSKDVSCVGEMEKCLLKNEKAFDRVWDLVGAVCEGQRITQDVLRAFFYVEDKLNSIDSSDSLSDPHWHNRVVKDIGFLAIDAAVRRSRLGSGGANPRYFGEALVDLINKRARRRLKLHLEEE